MERQKIQFGQVFETAELFRYLVCLIVLTNKCVKLENCLDVCLIS